MTHGDRTLARRAWRRRRLHAQLDRRPVRAPVAEVGPRGTMVPVGARPATLATGRGDRRQPSREDETLLPAATTSSAVGPGDEDGGAVRAADAAPPVVPEEADPGGADVAVAAPADGHPLDGLRAHAAGARRYRSRRRGFPGHCLPPVSETNSISRDSKSTRTARLHPFRTHVPASTPRPPPR